MCKIKLVFKKSSDPDMLELWEVGKGRDYLLAVIHKDFFLDYPKVMEVLEVNDMVIGTLTISREGL